LVFPYNTDIIWAGTEIGIFESLDNGQSWHYSNNGFPAVSVWQMFIQDNKIVIATHGRGIWTASQWPGDLPESTVDEILNFTLYPNPNYGVCNLEFISEEYQTFTLNIFSTNGKKVYSGKTFKNELRYIRQYDFSFLPKGTYILTLESVGKSYSTRFVRQ
jgi:hypothetical protein